MGTYYELFNHTKKERVHYDNSVKCGPIQLNHGVQMAFCNYMMDNEGDKLQFLSDNRDDYYIEDYKNVDLKDYKWSYFVKSIHDNLEKEIQRRYELRDNGE